MTFNPFHSAWDIIQQALTWFFPETLLAEPLIQLLMQGTFFVFGMWFLGALLFKPCYMFLKWLFKQFRG